MKKSLKHTIGDNFWRLLTVAVAAFMTIVIGRTLIAILRTHSEISRLNREKERCLQSIAEDSTLVESLNYVEYLERYAREKYHMQRRDEKVYIIEK